MAHRAGTRGVGHASPRGRPGGAMWQGGWQVKGPWVSGPWLEVWGGNANAFSRPTFYTYLLLNFLPCGTMSPWKITFARRDLGSIEPQSWLIHGQSWHMITSNWWPTIIVQLWPPIGTYSRIKRPKFFGQKSPLKIDVFLLISELLIDS